MIDTLSSMRDETGKLPAYAWPGGYPIYYLTADNGVMCPNCANSDDCNPDNDPADDWRIVAGDIHWEGESLTCDNCNAQIESAYGPIDD